jgi:acetyl-CoA carboxylase biotin carboxyl carrier protein
VTLTHSAPASPAAAPATPAATAAPAPPARKLIDIISPAPGTFYNREKPESAPYVQIGSRVSPTTVVGLLEAMKLYSEILAECSGVIVEALAENGQAVEYGTVLFRVDPTS